MKVNVPHPVESIQRCLELASRMDSRATEIREEVGECESNLDSLREDLAAILQSQAQLLRTMASALGAPLAQAKQPGRLIVPGRRNGG